MTRSDRDIERLLEDWLETEAQPMPHDVLEGALESVSRTAQVGGRRRGLGWYGNRPMGMALGGALLVLIAITGGLALDRFDFLFSPGSGQGPGRVWDPVADWRSAPNQENPSRDQYGNPGVWSYMRSTVSRHDPTKYTFMPAYDGSAASWNEPTMVNVLVQLNAADAAIDLHPTSGVYSILAWTSPMEGEITITGTVARPQDPCDTASGALSFSVDRGPASLRTIGLDNGQRSEFNLTAIVGSGDTLYFVVDAVADANCDLTSLQLRITSR